MSEARGDVGKSMPGRGHSCAKALSEAHTRQVWGAERRPMRLKQREPQVDEVGRHRSCSLAGSL